MTSHSWKQLSLRRFSNASLRRLGRPGFTVMKKSASSDVTRVGWMSRALLVGTLLFAGPFLSMSWAQNKIEPTQTGPSFPFTKTTFRWDYSCPAGLPCSFVCPGGGATHVLKLSLYLGTVAFDSSQNAPAVFYEFITREFPHSSGLSVGAGLTTLSCQVDGMTLDYSGLPK